jgi:hypothetical protein
MSDTYPTCHGNATLRDIYLYLKDNPMSHDSRESEDNFGEEHLENASEAPRSTTSPVREPVLGTMLPDLFAGEIAAMGRLLVKMSAALSRRALAEQDVLVRCRDAANELRAQALFITEKCTKGVVNDDIWNPFPGLASQVLSNLLLDLSASLTEAVESLDERHSNV